MTLKKTAEEGVKEDEPPLAEDEVNVTIVGAEGEKVEEQPTSSTVVAPKKAVKAKSLSFKVDLGEADVPTEAFKKDVKGLTELRKKEMIKEMGQEVKDLLIKRQYLLDEGKGGKKTNKSATTFNFKVSYDDAGVEADFQCEGTDTIAGFRDNIGKHFGVLKSHWRDWTLIYKTDINLCESSRATVETVAKKTGLTDDDKIHFVKYT